MGHICVDLDGTLAFYDQWRGPSHIGAPIPAMVSRVKEALAAGNEVRIMTARVSGHVGPEYDATVVAIDDWCLEHLGRVLPVTCTKDMNMIEIWDDRAKQVIPNTGIFLEDVLSGKADLPGA